MCTVIITNQIILIENIIKRISFHSKQNDEYENR